MQKIQQTTRWNIFIIFPRKQAMTLSEYYLIAWNVKAYCLGNIRQSITKISFVVCWTCPENCIPLGKMKATVNRNKKKISKVKFLSRLYKENQTLGSLVQVFCDDDNSNSNFLTDFLCPYFINRMYQCASVSVQITHIYEHVTARRMRTVVGIRNICVTYAFVTYAYNCTHM